VSLCDCLSLLSFPTHSFDYRYRQEPLLHLPFEFLEMLIEIDNNVSLFRHAHATMVGFLLFFSVFLW
jgi:hypothetical protein